MKNIDELVEFADKLLLQNQKVPNDIIEEIKNFVEGSGYVGIAQLNTIAGNLEHNAKKIAKYIKFATSIGLDLVVFPEFSLTGVGIEKAIQRYPVIAENCVKWLEGLAKLTSSTIAIVGFIDANKLNKEPNYHSSVAILQEGRVKKVIHNTNPEMFNNYYILVGAILSNKKELKMNENTLVINCAASLSRTNKAQIDDNMYSSFALKHNVPYVFANQVGATDCLSFNGESKVYNSKGVLIAKAKSFEEQLIILDPCKNGGNLYQVQEQPYNDYENFSFDYEYDLERTYKTVIQGIKDYFDKCGLKRAVLGLSGGLDSAVCAVLLTDALEKENVFGVSMPSYITSDTSKSDAETLAANLGINFITAPIRAMIDTTKESLNSLFDYAESKWSDRFKNSYTNDNIQARARATFLWCISNEFPSCIPIATSDKSELYMGYATINGDMSGGFAPIADITKTKLFALARWLNENRKQKNVIPNSIITKKPGAELAINDKTGKPLTAEEALMPYEFLDEIIWRIENKKESYETLLKTKFIYENQNSVPAEQKKEWLDKFYRRISTGYYKWSIMPPAVIVDSYSINKCEYSQPITSSGINYREVTEDYIQKAL